MANPQVELHITGLGVITLELDAEKAPLTTANFLAYVNKGHYNNTVFHRVIPGFIIQAGDPLSKDWTVTTVGTGGPGYTIPDEANGLRFDQPGRLAMANKGTANSAGSQFFITEVRAPQIDGSYTIFGQCGPLDIIKVAARVPSNPQTARPDLPLTLQKVVIRR